MKIEQWRGLTIQDHLQSLRGLGIGCSRDDGQSGREAGRPLMHSRPTSDCGQRHTFVAAPMKCEQVMMAWDAMDSRTQSQIFRAQLRSAKCPKALVHEMTNFCNYKYGDHPDDLRLVAKDTRPQAVSAAGSVQTAIGSPSISRTGSQACINDSSISLIDLTQISESAESRSTITLEDTKFGDLLTTQTPNTNIYRAVDRLVNDCADKHCPGGTAHNSLDTDIHITTKAYREALANLRKDQRDIFAIPAYKQPQGPKESKNRDEIAREASVEELPRSPAWLGSNCGFLNSPMLQECQAQGKMAENDRYTEEGEAVLILPPLKRDLKTAIPPPLRPLLDMRALLEERLQEAQLKRTRKAEEERTMQDSKRIKLEACNI